MTYKQIIIDNIDVSGCEHYKGVEKIEKSLIYIWSECVLEIVSAKQYKDIQKLFEERIKNV